MGEQARWSKTFVSKKTTICPSLPDGGEAKSCSSATFFPPSSAAASAPLGEVDAVLRRLDDVPWWSRALARFLFRRERRALAVAGGLGIAPPLLFAGRDVLVRGWIDGIPLHIAKPHGDAAYFRSAKAALRRLHRAGIAHNDLAKEQNWLYADSSRVHDRFPARVLFRSPQRSCSASPATRICAICSSTSAATLPAR